MTVTDASTHIDEWVRPIPDFPAPGVTFRDITPLLAQPSSFAAVIEAMANAVTDLGDVDALLGVEARGFILAAPLATRLGVGFVPVRKQGKLPSDSISASYDLEYGSATIEMHSDAVRPGARVVIVDDVLATGGTLSAAKDLAEQADAEVLAHLVMIEIGGLGGRERLVGTPVVALHTYGNAL